MTKDEKIKEYLEILQKQVSDLTDDEIDKGYKLAKDKDIQNVLEKARVEDFAKAASLPATMGAGAIRTVAGSMPAAAINEEQAIAEFTAKKVIIKKCAANLRQLAEELSENVKNSKDIQYIMSDLLSHARLFDMMADELEQAARNLIKNRDNYWEDKLNKGYDNHSKEDCECEYCKRTRKKTAQAIFADIEKLAHDEYYWQEFKRLKKKWGVVE